MTLQAVEADRCCAASWICKYPVSSMCGTVKAARPINIARKPSSGSCVENPPLWASTQIMVVSAVSPDTEIATIKARRALEIV